MTTNLQILNQQVQNPFEQFEIVVGPNGRERIDYAFNNVKVLASTSNQVRFRVQGSGKDTLIPAGLGVKYDSGYSFLEVINPTASSVTVTLGLAMGTISDDRLVLSGTVTVSEEPATTATPTQVTVTSIATLVLAANSARKSFLIQNADSTNPVEYLGTDNTAAFGDGQLLLAGGGGTLSDNVSGNIYMICASGKTADVRVIENV